MIARLSSRLTFIHLSSKFGTFFDEWLGLMIQNIAGYKFVSLDNLSELRGALLEQCSLLGIKGTILLSMEGINISLAGMGEAIQAFKSELKQDTRFADMTFRESFSAEQPFRRMKVKLRNEIITIRRPELKPEESPAPSISPHMFKQWLDEKRDMVVLDTRNDYEFEFGTFVNATHLGLKDFSEFPEKTQTLPKDKPIVMFCTGGIRCEKAAVHLLNQGFEEVYQLQGGILNYFTEVGGEHYQGECFVFDGRLALDSQLQVTGTLQCEKCQGPIKQTETHSCH